MDGNTPRRTARPRFSILKSKTLVGSAEKALMRGAVSTDALLESCGAAAIDGVSEIDLARSMHDLHLERVGDRSVSPSAV